MDALKDSNAAAEMAAAADSAATAESAATAAQLTSAMRSQQRGDCNFSILWATSAAVGACLEGLGGWAANMMARTAGRACCTTRRIRSKHMALYAGLLAGHYNPCHESDVLTVAVSQPVLRRLCDIEHDACQCPHIEERRQAHRAVVAEQPKWTVRHGVDLIGLDLATERHTLDLGQSLAHAKVSDLTPDAAASAVRRVADPINQHIVRLQVEMNNVAGMDVGNPARHL